MYKILAIFRKLYNVKFLKYVQFHADWQLYDKISEDKFAQLCGFRCYICRVVSQMKHPEALHRLIAERIIRLRNSLKINQEDLATKVGVSRSTISNIEAAKYSIPIKVLYSLAEVLQTEIHFLLPTEPEVREKMSEDDAEGQIVIKLEKKDISQADIDAIKRNLL